VNARTDAPGPLQRRGPRPLLLHLTLAMLRSSVSRSTSLNWRHGWPPSNETIAAAIRDALMQGTGAQGASEACPGEAPPAGFPGAVLTETLRQDAALIEGIAAYRRHPWRREMADPPALWQEGGSRLLE
jgi:polyhydroxyalkanoate synthase subunit PhaC